MVIILALIAKILITRNNVKNIIPLFPGSSDLYFVPIESTVSGKSKLLEYKVILMP